MSARGRGRHNSTPSISCIETAPREQIGVGFVEAARWSDQFRAHEVREDHVFISAIALGVDAGGEDLNYRALERRPPWRSGSRLGCPRTSGEHSMRYRRRTPGLLPWPTTNAVRDTLYSPRAMPHICGP